MLTKQIRSLAIIFLTLITFTSMHFFAANKKSERKSTPDKVLVLMGNYDNIEVLLQNYYVDIELMPMFGGIGHYNQKTFDKLSSPEFLSQFEAVFLNCGLTDQIAQLKNKDQTKDEYFHDPIIQENFRNYVENGGKLYATDWSLTTVARIFKNKYFSTNYYNGIDLTPNENIPSQEVEIQLISPELKQTIGKDSITVREEIGGVHYITKTHSPDIKILATGVLSSDSGNIEAPMLIEFPFSKGKVVLANLHIEGEEVPEKKQIKKQYFIEALNQSNYSEKIKIQTQLLQDESLNNKDQQSQALFQLYQDKENQNYYDKDQQITHIKDNQQKYQNIIPPTLLQKIKSAKNFNNLALQLTPEEFSIFDQINQLINLQIQNKEYPKFLSDKSKFQSELFEYAQEKLKLEVSRYQEIKQALPKSDNASYQQALISESAFELQQIEYQIQNIIQSFPQLKEQIPPNTISNDITNIETSDHNHDLYHSNFEKILGFALEEKLELTNKSSSTNWLQYIIIIIGSVAVAINHFYQPSNLIK